MREEYTDPAFVANILHGASQAEPISSEGVLVSRKVLRAAADLLTEWGIELQEHAEALDRG